MKFLLILPLLLISCSANIHSIKTKENKEIDEQIRSKIEIIKNEFIENTKNAEYAKVKKLFSIHLLALLESENFDFDNYMNQINPIFNKLNFIIKDEYYSVMDKIGTDSKATIIPSLSEDKFIINNFTFLNNEIYNIFLITNNPGRQYLMFLSLSQYDEEWKINTIHIGNYGFDGLNAPELYRKSKEYIENERPLSAILYTVSINEFLRPAPFLQYKDENIYKEFITDSVNTINELMQFPKEISNIKIFGMKYDITNEDGFIPIIQYITQTDLDAVKLKEELLNIEEEINEYLENMKDDFPALAFRAFNEMPSDPKKTYNSYTTVLSKNR